MRERAISAAVIAVVVIVVFLLGQPWLTLGLAALAGVAAFEAFRLLPKAGFPVAPLPGVIAPPLAVLALGLAEETLRAAGVFIAVVVIVGAIDAFRQAEVRDGFLAWMGTTFTVVYVSLIAFTTAILVWAPEVPEDALLGGVLDNGRVWLLVLVLTVWSFDTFAYLSGRTFGRGRFLNHISPNKTWSGVIGGAVAATIVAGALVWAAGEWWPGGLLLGLVVAVAGQAGDVAESMLKRTADVKDSSDLIPGHGGILDRVDSFLFAAPIVFGYVLIVGS